MIAWVVTTTKEATTGVTSVIGSTSSTEAYTSAVRLGVGPANPNQFTQTETRTTEFYLANLSLTSVGPGGTTTKTGSTFFSSNYNAFLPEETTDSDYAQGLIDAGYNTALITSQSQEGETTTAGSAFTVETSTTATVEAFVSVTASATTLAEEVVLFTTTATNSDGTTTTALPSTETQTQTTWITSQAATTATIDSTTIEDTSNTVDVPGSVGLATVIQANTIGPDAEILYLLTSRPTSWNGYSAATAFAQSGTRLTMVGSSATASVAAIGTQSQTSVSTYSAPEVSASTPHTVTATTQTTRTVVTNVLQIPNGTGTQTASAARTTGSTTSYTVFGGESFTYGYSNTAPAAAITTRQKTIWGTTYGTAQRWRHTLSFHLLTSRPTSSTVAETWPVAITEIESSETSTGTIESSYTNTETYEDGTLTKTDTLTYSTSTASGSTFASSVHKARNAYADYSEAVLQEGANETSRTRWVASGAAVGTQAGLFVTAAQTITIQSVVKNGQSVYLTQYEPRTNSDMTVDWPSVTYSTTTTTTGAATSTSTTSSLVAGVSGVAFVTVDSETTAQAIQPAGGGSFAGTVVERAGPGAYRNRINGTTTSFAGADTSYASSTSAALKKWVSIKALGGMGQGGSPVTWSEARNVPDLPPL